MYDVSCETYQPELGIPKLRFSGSILASDTMYGVM